ncbi:unnamed protein product [Hermetia illucens]|uniref:Uncharacterized protein n=1 Tax=Hermetia illucens TaxID=343691 RepID=A0A7R8UW32_HERIL|nr:unnamed protein product [Hermetia illucens]
MWNIEDLSAKDCTCPHLMNNNNQNGGLVTTNASSNLMYHNSGNDELRNCPTNGDNLKSWLGLDVGGDGGSHIMGDNSDRVPFNITAIINNNGRIDMNSLYEQR